MIWALQHTVAASQALWSPTSSALNANCLATCKARKYTASSIRMYIIVYSYINTTLKLFYIYKKCQSLPHQIACCAWLVIVLYVMDSLLVDHGCQSSMISWLQVTLECTCKFCMIFWLQVTLEYACKLHRSCCIGWALVWISYRTVSGALLCSCRLFAPHFSAINSLQECSRFFGELKGGTAFAG